MARKYNLLIFGCIALLGGCETVPELPPAAKTPPSTDVTRLQAWKDAEAVAALAPDRYTVIGKGDSMLPVYGPNTVLVLQKVDFDALEPGMNVAYMSSHGTMVVHRLLERKGEGWRVAGFNNPDEDRDLVTRYTLLGVVYAAFAPDLSK